MKYHASMAARAVMVTMVGVPIWGAILYGAIVLASAF